MKVTQFKPGLDDPYADDAVVDEFEVDDPEPSEEEKRIKKLEDEIAELKKGRNPNA